MKELSLNILDIAGNSIKAGANHITVEIADEGNWRSITVSDDGCGMSPEFLRSVTDPFTTTRTTRPVGLGIPFFKLAAEQTGGTFQIESRQAALFPEKHGTRTSATFQTDHMDCAPLGDLASTITALIQGSPERHWRFVHRWETGEKVIDTEELKAVLGCDVPLNEPAVLAWIQEAWNEVQQEERE